MAKEVVFKFKVEVDGKEVEQSVNSIDGFQKRISDLQTKLNSAPLGSKQFQDLQKELKATQGAFDTVKSSNQSFLDNLAAAPGILGTVGQSIQGVGKVFGSFNMALKTSFFGILATIIGKVVEKLMSMEGVLDPLTKITEIFSTAMGKLANVVLKPLTFIIDGVALGLEKLGNLFGSLTGQGDTYGDTLGNISEGLDELDDSQAAFELQLQKSNRALQEAREIAADETKSIEERKKALEDAGNLERQLAKENRERVTQRARLNAQQLAAELGFNEERIKAIGQYDAKQLESFTQEVTNFKNLNRDKLNSLLGYIGEVENIAADEAKIGKKVASQQKSLDNQAKADREAKAKDIAAKAKENRQNQIADYDSQLKLLFTFVDDSKEKNAEYYSDLKMKAEDYYKKRNELEDKDKKLTASQLKQRQLDQKKAIDDGINALIQANDKTKQLDSDVIKSADAVTKAKQKQTQDIIDATIKLQQEQDAQYEKDNKRLEDAVVIAEKLYGKDSEQYKLAIIAKNKADEAYFKNTTANNQKIEEGQKARNERLKALDEGLADSQLQSLTNGLQKQLAQIKADGDKKVEAYKKQLQDSLAAGDISLEELEKKLAQFRANVNAGVESATKEAVGSDFIANLEKDINALIGSEEVSFFKTVDIIEEKQDALDKAYKDGLISQKEYADGSKKLDDALVASKQKVINGLNFAAQASLQVAEAFGEESAAGKVLIKVNQALALASTAVALAETLKGLGKDIAKGFPQNLIAVASTIALIGTAFVQAKQLFSKGKSSAEVAVDTEPRALAAGGVVSGPGTSTSDSIPARLSNGESVINAKSTAMFAPLLSAINQAGGGVPFQFGGIASANEMSLQEQSSQIAQALGSQNTEPIKTYVVAQDMSSQQMFDRAQKFRSTI